ncbi:zinc-dependent metalloprotease [Actinospongicola halichondriae]|uniref:zinc-dependent metalloprotease n=1 Tax=Actinospongicola halichondriae TaxID=3236844 RepID=UPI003D3BE6BB
MADLVDWDLAERIAVRAAGREPLADSYLADSLEADFEELTALAEELVEAETGLRSLSGAARGQVTDRAGWVRANIASFQRLLSPVTDRMSSRVRGPGAVVMRTAAAAEVGMLLGWMSGRVLGQYDLLMAAGDDDRPDDVGDTVYYVGPNVLSLEKRFGFPPREFRLWLAIHEVTHRAQFTGVPWMRSHYLGLIDSMLSSASVDPMVLVRALKRAVDEIRAGRSPMSEGGLAHVLASPEQRVVLDQIGGLMSLLEGHGDVTMNRAGIDHVPSADRFARVLQQRRASANAVNRTVQRVLGLEAKLNQYQQGEDFIAEVERLAGGKTGLEPAWRGPSWLPTLAEIRDPQEWVDRVRLSEELVT